MKAALLAGALFLAALAPRLHGDFGHYTFALTWQPGICSTDEGCTSDQPHAPLIGLHGLWASRPRALIAEGVPLRTWWSKGCDVYHRSDAPPPISAALRSRLDAVMPHFAHSLLTHEYDKHVQCFEFDPTAFFTTELAMRADVANGPFGRYLVASEGRTVTHSAVMQRFAAVFATKHVTSLQLQCAVDRDGREVLTQVWMTIDARDLAAFPRGESLVNATTNQDTCPKFFLIPGWERR